MDKKICRIICFVLIIAIIFSFAGCGDTEDVWSEYIQTVEIPQEDTASVDSEKEDVASDTTSIISDISENENVASDKTSQEKIKTKQTGNIRITESGKTLYKIVVSMSNDGYDQGRLIQKVIKLTTGVSVPLVLDNEPSVGPEIIVGDTARKQSIACINELGKNEYAVKTDNDRNVIIAAKREYLIQLAAEKFLSDYFGYKEDASAVGKEKSIPLNLYIKQNLLNSYKLVWSDEFNGDSLDMNKWCFRTHMSEQKHLKLYSDKRAVNVKDGCLNLISGRIDDENYFANVPVSTAETFIFKYGYLEIKAKVPFGKPAFPAFWMQSSVVDAKYPDIMAEIDIMEMSATEKSVAPALHKWYKNEGTHFAGGYYKGSPPRYTFNSKTEAEKWHTYSLLWTPDDLNFMIDGEIYATFDITDAGDFGGYDDGMGCFRDFEYIILNNYLFTADSSIADREKNATKSDKFPITFSIDYIRLYQLPGNGSIKKLQ